GGAVCRGERGGVGIIAAGVLGERGYDLVIGGRELEPLLRAAELLQQYGGRVRTVNGDLADAAVRARLIEEARDLGGVHVLVNNASELGGIGPVLELDPERFERVLRVNLIAPIELTRLAGPLLIASRGLVINISSDAANGAYPGWGAYGASKAALHLITRTLAGELRDHGVSAVSVDPG